MVAAGEGNAGTSGDTGRVDVGMLAPKCLGSSSSSCCCDVGEMTPVRGGRERRPGRGWFDDSGCGPDCGSGRRRAGGEREADLTESRVRTKLSTSMDSVELSFVLSSAFLGRAMMRRGD